MSSQTQFVSSNGRVAVQSYQPCHLFGDGDLYGKGVRASFYIQYSIAIVALCFKLEEEIRSARLGLAVIASALFVDLCVNSTGENVVVLDWVMVLELISFLPLYAIWRPLYDKVIHVAASYFKKNLAQQEAKALRLQQEAEALYQEREALTQEEGEARGRAEEARSREAEALTRSYREWIRSLLTLHDASIYDRDYDEARNNYHRTLYSFLPRLSLENQAPAAIHPHRSGGLLETLRLLYIARLRDIYTRTAEERGRDEAAERLDAELARVAERIELQTRVIEGLQSEEHAMTRIRREHKSLWQHEKTTLAIVTLIWAAYLCAAPWIFFKATNKGRKEGCDIRLRTLFAPISVYNKAYLIFLRVSACIGVVFIALLVVLIGKHLSSRLIPKSKDSGLGISTNNKETGPRGDINTEARTEIDIKDIERGSERVYEFREFVRDIIYRAIGVPSCLIALICVVVQVELTIKTNNIDLSKSSITSTSQLLPLLITCFTALPVLLKLAELGKEHEEDKKKSWVRQVMDKVKETMKSGTKVNKDEGQDAMNKRSTRQKVPEVSAEEGEGVLQPQDV